MATHLKAVENLWGWIPEDHARYTADTLSGGALSRDALAQHAGYWGYCVDADGDDKTKALWKSSDGTLWGLGFAHGKNDDACRYALAFAMRQTICTLRGTNEADKALLLNHKEKTDGK